MGKRTNKLIPFLSQSKSLDSSSSKLNNNNNNNNNNDSSNYSSSSPPWLFPTCGGNIKTLSFRETSNNFYKDDNFKTFNSAFLETSDSLFTVSSSSRRSFSTLSDDFCLLAADPIDNDSLIRGLRSDRLFFEPDLTCSLLLQQKQQQPDNNEPVSVPVPVPVPVVYKESEAMCLESQNPCEDFRRSMEEMVEAHGLKDWQGLEELLECYLKINAKFNHAYIIAAFIDLLVNLSFISSSSTTTTTTTTTSTSNTNSHNNTSTSITTTSTSSSSSLLSNNNNIINNNCSLSSPSSPLSLPSSSLTTPSLSSLFDLGDDDHCNHDNDDVR